MNGVSNKVCYLTFIQIEIKKNIINQLNSTLIKKLLDELFC